jgi:predicted transcriptional regulator
MTNRTPQPLRTKGGAWGPERVRLGISLKELARRTGINSGTLSHLESGRMNPTGAEFERVMAVLRDAEAQQSEGTAPEASTAPA